MIGYIEFKPVMQHFWPATDHWPALILGAWIWSWPGGYDFLEKLKITKQGWVDFLNTWMRRLMHINIGGWRIHAKKCIWVDKKSFKICLDLQCLGYWILFNFPSSAWLSRKRFILLILLVYLGRSFGSCSSREGMNRMCEGFT